MEVLNLNFIPDVIVILSSVLQVLHDVWEMFLKGKIMIVLFAITVVFLGVLNSLRIRNQHHYCY